MQTGTRLYGHPDPLATGQSDRVIYARPAPPVVSLVLYFTHEASPELYKAEFSHPRLAPSGRITVRGKDQGAHPAANGSFEWTIAVKVFVAYLLRCGVWAMNLPAQPPGSLPVLKGGKGSAAASLSFAISKRPQWSEEVFGCPLSEMFLRSNGDLKRSGEPVVLHLDTQAFDPAGIQVRVGEAMITALDQIEGLAASIEATYLSAKALPKVMDMGATLKLQGSLDDWTPQKAREVKAFLAKKGITNVEILRVEEGCIKLTLRLPADQAELLVEAYRSGELECLKALGCELGDLALLDISPIVAAQQVATPCVFPSPVVSGPNLPKETDKQEYAKSGKFPLTNPGQDLPLISRSLMNVSRGQALKRALDLSLASVFLVLALPLMLLLAVLIRLTSRGPVLYWQLRAGRGGKQFLMYKFRTMSLHCEKNGGTQWSMPGDPRVTRLGRFLRASHLDELPQLINVLLGHMSLVGPRPERPEFVPGLVHLIPGYADRLLVLPGVTGLAQVHLPADTDLASVRLKLLYDCWYIEKRTFGLDVRLIACTSLTLFFLPLRLCCQLFRIPSPGCDWVRRSVSLPPISESPVATGQEASTKSCYQHADRTEPCEAF